MKIGIFTDIHGNLPALEKSIERFQELKCDEIIHLGDMIGIGPYPKECLELSLSIKEMKFIMGNHDYWYCNGLPTPNEMNNGELSHHKWIHNEIGESYKESVKAWKLNIEYEYYQNKKITFRHYGLNKEKSLFKSIIKNPTAKELDEIFEDVESEIIFYGHEHQSSDKKGRSRYVNLGSAGCFDKPKSRIGILEIQADKLILRKESLEYNDKKLLKEFEKRKVPERDFILNVFMKRN